MRPVGSVISALVGKAIRAAQIAVMADVQAQRLDLADALFAHRDGTRRVEHALFDELVELGVYLALFLFRNSGILRFFFIGHRTGPTLFGA